MNLVVLLFVFAFFSLIALAQLLSVFINKAKFAGVFGLLVVVVFGAVGVSPFMPKILPILTLTPFEIYNM
jgi:hypothetical protein